MRLSQILFQTLREDPADADVRSHALMARAGFLQKLASGIYTYGPFLLRVLKKIERIIREEHDRAGCQEMLMPAAQPREIWEESDRWDRYIQDRILFHFRDRKGADLCLGPTHEEVVTTFARQQIQSYKQLPQTLYQIQTKFRDEIRPRFGLMRGREFIMKDAYSFDRDAEGMKASYDKMRQVYFSIFERCGLRFTPVEADPGAIGGSGSEEFMVDAATGEDSIAVCRSCNYAANTEKASSRIAEPPACPQTVDRHIEDTPGAKTVDELCTLFPDLPRERMLKTVLYKACFADNEITVAVMSRGDRQLNEVKIANHLGALALDLADEETVRKASGAEPGFAGPLGLDESVRLLADTSVEGVEGFLCGGNETDKHWLDVHFGRDLEMPETVELGLAEAGDGCPRCEGALELTRGIEVGHIFQLGTKYSQPMSGTFSDEDQKEKPYWMGCYGLGVSRVAASAIEQNHDENGMIWPMPLAPYHVLLIQMRAGDEAQDSLASRLYNRLAAAGVEVLWDDRKDRPGSKFKDADLVGIPLRIVVGRDAADDLVEWKPRRGGEADSISADEAAERVIQAVESLA